MNSNRYPGTHPFTLEDQAVFFGREDDVEELMQLVELEALTVLYGKSGLGKSSLIQAGLLPRLLRDINFKLEKIRVLFRVCFERKYISEKQYVFISEQVNVAGRMVGGWSK